MECLTLMEKGDIYSLLGSGPILNDYSFDDFLDNIVPILTVFSPQTMIL